MLSWLSHSTLSRVNTSLQALLTALWNAGTLTICNVKCLTKTFTLTKSKLYAGAERTSKFYFQEATMVSWTLSIFAKPLEPSNTSLMAPVWMLNALTGPTRVNTTSYVERKAECLLVTILDKQKLLSFNSKLIRKDWPVATSALTSALCWLLLELISRSASGTWTPLLLAPLHLLVNLTVNKANSTLSNSTRTNLGY